MTNLYFYSLGYSPIIFMVIYLYFKRHRDQDVMKLMIRSFFAGGVSVSLFVLALTVSKQLGIGDLLSLNRTIFFSFITAAFSSEVGKFIVFRYYIMRTKKHIHPADTILLSVSTALGFSAIAMFFFVFNFVNIQQSLSITLLSLIYIPASLIFSVVMGFFIGMARYLKTHIVYSLTGLLGAIFFHGTFTFCLVTRDYRLLNLFAFGSLVIVFVLAMKAAFTVPEEPESEPEQSE